MTNSSRRELYKKRQADFIRSVFAGSLEGNLVGASILHKRSATLAERWPALRRHLGDRWSELFTQHALESAKEFCDDARRDGISFANFVRRVHGLDRDSSRELRLAKYAELKRRVRALFR